MDRAADQVRVGGESKTVEALGLLSRQWSDPM